MLSESYFSFAPFTTFATNAFNIRDNYCRLQKNVVTLHLEIRRTTASPPALPRREGSPMLITSEYVSAGRQTANPL